MILVVGLGNPEAHRRGDRHNLGWMVLDHIAGVRKWATVEHALVCRKPGVALMKPTAGMNDSGKAIAAETFNQLIVVHDELDIPFGVVRIKSSGKRFDHNGLKDIVRALEGTGFVGPFSRVRVGIGRPSVGNSVLDHVLSPPSVGELLETPKLIAQAADAVQKIIELGVDRATQAVNSL